MKVFLGVVLQIPLCLLCVGCELIVDFDRSRIGTRDAALVDATSTDGDSPLDGAMADGPLEDASSADAALDVDAPDDASNRDADVPDSASNRDADVPDSASNRDADVPDSALDGASSDDAAQ